MKHKSIHISWIIICIIAAGIAFLSGMIYGEKAEKKRISESFIKVFQEQFGSGSATSGVNSLSGAIK